MRTRLVHHVRQKSTAKGANGYPFLPLGSSLLTRSSPPQEQSVATSSHSRNGSRARPPCSSKKDVNSINAGTRTSDFTSSLTRHSESTAAGSHSTVPSRLSSDPRTSLKNTNGIKTWLDQSARGDPWSSVGRMGLQAQNVSHEDAAQNLAKLEQDMKGDTDSNKRGNR